MNFKECPLVSFFGVLILLVFAASASVTAEIVTKKSDRTVAAASQAAQAIQSKFVSQGMSGIEASNLVNQMSAEEISYYGENTDRMQVAGDSGAGVLIFILVVAVLVYLIVFLGRRV